MSTACATSGVPIRSGTYGRSAVPTTVLAGPDSSKVKSGAAEHGLVTPQAVRRPAPGTVAADG